MTHDWWDAWHDSLTDLVSWLGTWSRYVVKWKRARVSIRARTCGLQSELRIRGWIVRIGDGDKGESRSGLGDRVGRGSLLLREQNIIFTSSSLHSRLHPWCRNILLWYKICSKYPLNTNSKFYQQRPILYWSLIIYHTIKHLLIELQ